MDQAITVIFAALPILGLMVALGVFRVPAHWAGLGTLVLTLPIAFWIFDADLVLLAFAALEGAIIALWPIMIVIVAAIFMYNVAQATGALTTIKNMLSGITTDKRIQVLILVWGFGSFLEAVAGYGTAVAIPASILIVLGFKPIFAAVICLIANTVSTAHGAVGIAITILGKLTGLDPVDLSVAVGLQLLPFILLIPFVLVMVTGRSIKAVKGVFWITLASGVSFAIPSLLSGYFIGEQLPALLGSISSMLTTILLAKAFHQGEPEEEPASPVTLKEGVIAWFPYILVTAFIMFTSKLIPPVSAFIDQVQLSILSPLKGDGGAISIKLITPGVLIILAGFIGGSLQKAQFSQLVKTLGQTLVQLWKTTLTVVAILAAAQIMSYSGMVAQIAQFLMGTTGALYPLISPLVGTLGTFVTGSDTTSNVLFGQLQQSVAGNLGLSEVWLAAANTAGATAGKMISPQSIAVATGATGLQGQEGKILSQTLVYSLGYVLLAGLLVFFFEPVWSSVASWLGLGA
jgi:lactate permease